MESEGGSNIPIADDLMNFLLQYKWEGNIRELKNCIEYMSSICSHRMELPDLPEYLYDEYKKGFYKGGDAEKELPLADNSEERRTIKSVLTIIRDFSDVYKRQPPYMAETANPMIIIAMVPKTAIYGT